MSLPKKYKLQKIEDLWGNKSVKDSLAKQIAKPEEDRRHAFLFTGTPGTGKSATGEALRNELDIHDLSYFFYNTANTRGIETARRIIESAQYSPPVGKRQMFLFDECHMITREAWNSLLDLLDRPPLHSYFVFCSAEFGALNPTLQKAINRRCHTCPMQPLKVKDMQDFIWHILGKEGWIRTEDEEELTDVVDKIVNASNGSCGTALGFIDTINDMEYVEDMIEAIEDITASDVSVKDICKLILDGATWDESTRDAVRNLKGDAEGLRRGIVGYLMGALLNKRDGKELAWIISVLSNQRIIFENGRSGLNLMLFQAITGEDLKG